MVAIAPIAQSNAMSKSQLGDALSAVEKHIKSGGMSAAELKTMATELPEAMSHAANDKALMQQAFDVVKAYETSSKYGPLFMNADTSKGLSRKATGKEIHFVMAAIQQGLIDFAYTSSNLSKYSAILDGTKFETSAYFPGAVAMPTKSETYSAQINASNRKSWGSPTSNETALAKRPTGCYVAPGSIVKVTVPKTLANKGFNVRVGAHSWDHVKKPNMLRLDRVSLVYPITSTETLIGSPLGGGIYIEVPYEVDLGVVDIEITNAVRAPYFSARSFDKTTNAEWKSTERNNPGAWADFETDNFMMQVPTSWITKFEDPETLMADWDKAMLAVFKVRGLDPEKYDKSLLYVQIDVQMRGTANFPGYPQANYSYKPQAKSNGNENHWMLTGPLHADWTVLHELGHSVSITKFRGEVEALVNFMHVIVYNKAFGVDLGKAFGSSVGGKDQLDLDEVAVTWMVTETFRDGKDMNHSNRPGDEFKYQHRGYGKYVEIVDLFGWEALENFFYAYEVDYMGAKKFFPKSVNMDPVDNRIFQMSKGAGYDLTPLIHFWGIQPESPERLKAAIEKAGLKPSAKLYDKLQHYLTIIPKNNKEFLKHTSIFYPGGPRKSDKNNPLFGDGWYLVWMEKYDTTHHAKATAALNAIIDKYFPDGRPE